VFDATLTAAGKTFTIVRLDGFERSSDRVGSLRVGGLAASSGFAPGGELAAEIGVDGHEPPFHFRVEAFTTDLDTDYTATLVDTQARIEISWKAGDNDVKRSFCGHIFQCGLTRLGNPAEGRAANSYQFEIYPWVWYLTYSRRNRHWVNSTPDGILTEIGAAYGFTPGQYWRFEAGGDTALPYVVQHEQSDYDFLMELAERLHLSCYLRHQDDGPLLRIGNGASTEFWGAEVKLAFSSEHDGAPAPVVTRVTALRQTVPTVAKVANRRRPLATTSNFGVVGATSPGQPANGTISGGKTVFRYPAPLTSQGEAEAEADADLATMEAVRALFLAVSRHLPLELGQRVTFTHPFDRTGAIDGKGGVVKRLVHSLDKDRYEAWLEATPLG